MERRGGGGPQHHGVDDAASVASTIRSALSLSSSIASSHETATTRNSQPLRKSSSSAAAKKKKKQAARAVHQIRLSALRHNYACVESAANRQRCSVIVVVKADGYGHGALDTALHLADHCGVEAFAVATLEEGIALRKALDSTNKSQSSQQTTSQRPARIRILVLGPPVGHPRSFDEYHFHNIEVMIPGAQIAKSLMDWVANADERKRNEAKRAAMEAREQIVLGVHTKILHPAVRRPNSALDDDDDDDPSSSTSTHSRSRTVPDTDGSERDSRDKEMGPLTSAPVKRDSLTNENINAKPKPKPNFQTHASATLSNVSGSGLANEVRAILMSQQAAAARQLHQQSQSSLHSSSGSQTPVAPAPGSSATISLNPSRQESLDTEVTSTTAPATPPTKNAVTTSVQRNSITVPVASATKGALPVAFRGIEDTAKNSRTRELAAAKASAKMTGEYVSNSDLFADAIVLGEDGTLTLNNNALPSPPPSVPRAPARKKLRWHALVDSGMGRLGFKTQDDDDANSSNSSNSNDDDRHKNDEKKSEMDSESSTSSTETSATVTTSQTKAPFGSDSIATIKALHDAEVHNAAPIEFYGCCTHMADAHSSSDYTNEQMGKFLLFLERVRKADISIPTVSSDNSAALLTTNLNHFDANAILTQPGADTRGWVRIGGAIYGQRPSFPQLRAVSTLMASVQNVAVVKKGESVGYDRAYLASMDVRIATVTIGFADGYPRELGNGVGKVSIRGGVFSIAGNICMDMLMVELGPADESEGIGSQIKVGDVAVLWGPETDEDDGDGLVRLQDIAKILKTTQSALTCGLNKVRVQRQLS